jgi:hypothetical protein
MTSGKYGIFTLSGFDPVELSVKHRFHTPIVKMTAEQWNSL